MGLIGFLEAASAKVPVIVAAAVVAAVAGRWSNAPHWPFYPLTIALFMLAAALWARRGLARQFKSTEQLGFRRNRDWLAFEFLGQGTPRGYYLLGFVSSLALVLTGLRFPYAAAAIAGMMLTVAWGEDKRRHPSEELDRH